MDAAGHGAVDDRLLRPPRSLSTSCWAASPTTTSPRSARRLKYDIDAVYFGDDWGQQHGLQMGPRLWREFILPQLERMYAVVREAGKFVMIHSCGDVDELFDDLVAIGLNCFNPFQPEVMDVYSLLPRYRGRLAFHGGLSTQRTLPFGTVDGRAARGPPAAGIGARGRLYLCPRPRRGRRRAAGKHAGGHRNGPEPALRTISPWATPRGESCGRRRHSPPCAVP